MIRKAIFFYYVFFVLPLSILGQSECAKVKNGRFYFYSQDTKQSFLIIRNNTLQKEINVVTNDTSYWKTTWKSHCAFDLKFLRTTRVLSAEELGFYKSNFIRTQILKVTKDYYIFKGEVNGIEANAVTDTMWLRKQY